MKYDWIDKHLLSKAGVYKDYKKEWNWTRYLLKGKMIAATFTDESGRKVITLIRNFKIYILIIIVIILTGCASKDLEYESNSTYNELTEKSNYGKFSIEFDGFTGEEIRTFKTSHNKEISFEYSYLVTKGNLNVQIRDGEDKLLFDFKTGEAEYTKAKEKLAKETATKIEAIEIDEFGKSLKVQSDNGVWKIVLIGENADGKIDISW